MPYRRQAAVDPALWYKPAEAAEHGFTDEAQAAGLQEHGRVQRLTAHYLCGLLRASRSSAHAEERPLSQSVECTGYAIASLSGGRRDPAPGF